MFFESPEELYGRVFRALRPRTPAPAIQVQYRRYANANASVRLESGRLLVRISDVLEPAPAPVAEALAFILLAKLYRRPVPAEYVHRYRLYLSRGEVRQKIETLRQNRGRKYVSGPVGSCHDLAPLFDELNQRFFEGRLERPRLGWSRQPSRTLLGHYDAAHRAIILSRVLDRPEVPHLVVEYVLFHEMLHLKHPVEHRQGRRCVHTPAFREDEKRFPRLAEAKDLLKLL
ncbi:MAG: M48 family peptidase [Bryobacterales bacterium]|nr:M48 family peptidase [Bryobacterales bacterium]